MWQTGGLSIRRLSNRSFLLGLLYLLIAANFVVTQPATSRDSAASAVKARSESQPTTTSGREQPCQANLPIEAEDKSLRDKPVGPVNLCTDKLEQSSTQSTVKPALVTESSQSRSKRVDVGNFFREEVDNYPEAEINLALKRTPTETRELYNVINTPLDPNMNLTERTANFHNDDEGREESICRSVLRNIYPREAKREDSLVYVPNTQEFMQVIQAEICQSPNEECNYLQDSLPFGMHSTCIQKYSYKKLLFLDPLEKRMASDLFRYPSCCSCHVKHGSIDLRSSTSQNPTLPKSQRKETETLAEDGFAQLMAQHQASPLANSTTTDLSHIAVYHANLTTTVVDNQTLPMHKEPRRQSKNLKLESISPLITTRIDHSNRSRPVERSTTTRKPDRQTRAPQTAARAKSSNKPKQTADVDMHSTVVLGDDKVYTPINITDR